MVMQNYISQSLPAGAVLEYLICPSKTIFSFALPIYGSGTSTSASWVTSQPWYINTCFNMRPTCRRGQLASSMLRISHESRLGLPMWRMIPICRIAGSTLRHHFRGKNTSISSCRGSSFDPFPFNTQCGSHVQAA